MNRGANLSIVGPINCLVGRVAQLVPATRTPLHAIVHESLYLKQNFQILKRVLS